MRILVIGAGGVGSAVVPIAVRRDFFERMVVADYDLGRAERAVARFPDDARFVAARVDASRPRRCRRALPRARRSPTSSTRSTRGSSCRSSRAPSRPAPTTSTWRCRCRTRTRSAPYEQTGVKLGDEQFALADAWAAAGRLALVGIGVEPGLSDVFARYAADHLFAEIDEIGVRDGANLVVDGYDFAPSFSIWTTIEECLNPPVIWEADRGWFTTPPFSEPEVFDFPEGIGPVECVNVEHEEVLLIPRWVEAKRVTFKYGLGDEFINVLKVAPHARAWTAPRRSGSAVSRCRRATWSPRACRTRRRSATGCAARRAPARGSPGTGKDGQPRRGLPVPRGRQRVVRCGSTGRRRSSGRPRSTRSSRSSCSPRDVWSGQRRARAGGVRRRAVPRPADRLRLALGDARGRLIRSGAPSRRARAPSRRTRRLGRRCSRPAPTRPVGAPSARPRPGRWPGPRPQCRLLGRGGDGRWSDRRVTRSGARAPRRPTTARPRRHRADASASARRPPAGTGSRCRAGAGRRSAGARHVSAYQPPSGCVRMPSASATCVAVMSCRSIVARIAGSSYRTGMCRSIKTLRRADEAATTGELEAAARQYVRKISGYRVPSARNSEAFEGAIAEIAAASTRLHGDPRRRGRGRAGSRGRHARRPRPAPRPTSTTTRTRDRPALVGPAGPRHRR